MKRMFLLNDSSFESVELKKKSLPLMEKPSKCDLTADVMLCG